ncbi:MAG TPA: hypothetical protein VN151_10850 [Terracidiphilus sp.]|nr:hypothetical protein [Terracidiphilus sp.]
MNHRITFLAVVSSLVICLSAPAQNWSTFLDPSRAIDWTSAGFTIPSYTVACATQPTLTAGSSAASANTTAINAALASCDSTHNVVTLPSGTYYVAGISFGTQGHQVLRGAGSSLTDLIFTAEASCNGVSHGVCMKASTFTYNGNSNVQPSSGSNQCSWSAGYTQGTTSITLSSCGGTPTANKMLILDQANDTSDTGGVYICDSATSGCSYESNGSHDGRQINGVTHSQQQVVYANSVTNNGNGTYTVSITPGVFFTNIRSSQSPGAWWSAIVQNDGIEDLTLDGTSISDGNLAMFDCYQCWMKGVRSIDAGRNHVLLQQSMSDVIRDSYFYASQSHTSGSYGIEYQVASGTLIENNIFQQLTVPIMMTQTSGTVIDYNFGIDSYLGSSTFNGAYAVHNAGNEMNLWEGNNMGGIWADDAWGSSTQQTYFRNMLIGWGNGLTSSSFPVLLRSYNRAFNLVGNVLGQPSYHTQYQTYATSTTAGTGSSAESKSVYTAGWGSTGPGCSNPSCDPIVYSTLMRWGNYDVVSAATRWNSTEAAPASVTYVSANFTSTYFGSLSQTLPSSLYYSAAPSWWPTNKAWPAVGPDVTAGNVGTCTGTYSGAQGTTASQCSGGSLSSAWAAHVTSIPAQDCYLTTMGGAPDGTGSVLSFDASTCYSGTTSSSGTPAAPTGLTATVQ